MLETSAIVRIWLLIFDNKQVYSFTDHKKLKAAVIGYIHSYYENSIDKVIFQSRKLLDQLDEYKELTFVPVRFDKLNFFICKWDIDNTHVLHQILTQCESAIDNPELKASIQKLFTLDH